MTRPHTAKINNYGYFNNKFVPDINGLLWNVEFWSITDCIISWYVVPLQTNKLYSEHFMEILYSIVIHTCKVQISSYSNF